MSITRLRVAAEGVLVTLATNIASSVAVATAVFVLGFELLRYALGLVGLARLVPAAPAERLSSSVVITGASAGIGEGLAVEYARPGVWLGLTGRNEERLKEVADKCRQRGAQVEIGLVDVTDAAKLAEWLLKFDDAHPIDLVIANAGILCSQFPDLTLEQRIPKVFDVNVHGVFNTIVPLLPRFKARRSGQIAINSSLAGVIATSYPPAIVYATTKAAMAMFGQNLRDLLKPDNIAVSVIIPGFVRTNMTKDLEAKGETPFMISSEDACTTIRKQLAADIGMIAFPAAAHAYVFSTRPFPYNVRESAEQLLGHLGRWIAQKKSGTKSD